MQETLTKYFGQYDPNEFPDFGDDEFVHNGKHYWYKAVVYPDRDELVIYDTCDRHMPIVLESLKDLLSIVYSLEQYHQAVVRLEHEFKAFDQQVNSVNVY